jgi:AcrR family transcriptional regulator
MIKSDMDQSNMVEAGWRGSAEAWLDAAYEILIESGVDAVRIVPLSKKLKLSRTSFYWFFKDREALLTALLEKWRAKNTGSLVKQCECYAESITEAIFNVFDCWLDPALFDSKFEFAIRSWAQQSPKVTAAIRTADAIRIQALTDMFVRCKYEPLAADVRARTIYLTQIGYISMKTRDGPNPRLRRDIHGLRRPTPRARALSCAAWFHSRRRGAAGAERRPEKDLSPQDPSGCDRKPVTIASILVTPACPHRQRAQHACSWCTPDRSCTLTSRNVTVVYRSYYYRLALLR